MGVQKFRKKPVVIDAIQFTRNNIDEVKEFLGDFFGDLTNVPDGTCEFVIKTLEDGSVNQVKHVASENDYIIKGIKNEFYACKSDIFLASYEEVSDDFDPLYQAVTARNY
jgi:hypothetical protein